MLKDDKIFWSIQKQSTRRVKLAYTARFDGSAHMHAHNHSALSFKTLKEVVSLCRAPLCPSGPFHQKSIVLSSLVVWFWCCFRSSAGSQLRGCSAHRHGKSSSKRLQTTLRSSLSPFVSISHSPHTTNNMLRHWTTMTNHHGFMTARLQQTEKPSSSGKEERGMQRQISSPGPGLSSMWRNRWRSDRRQTISRFLPIGTEAALKSALALQMEICCPTSGTPTLKCRSPNREIL